LVSLTSLSLDLSNKKNKIQKKIYYENQSHVLSTKIYSSVLTHFLSNFLTTFHVVVFQIKIVQSFDPETIQTPSELNASALIEALLNLTKNQ
jgi:hypothetical protein